MAQKLISKTERLAVARRQKLEVLGLTLASDFKLACKTVHQSEKREIVWGAILPAIVPGEDDELDEVLEIFSQSILMVSFDKIEWFKAQAPTEWVDEPVRYNSIIRLRVSWNDETGKFNEWDPPPTDE
mmetsp:Transcript_30930/g.82104  ORF Transcript_30930/g.82104 Transcript_30930/m.82104 type:complete len:128 (-) Transcript_30930:176-559(-)|eukprot:CAMPEP_0194538704 /NCGR_PEP_ID=MMETSP0253-20130528/78353_1 /TAXON_ID=2966 /ORGANISM="Noctiluca scintillans" /LENGTH=127 /DNA_ID=CAMNT_0039384869 /DNA_START=55 /DNA_END=438 /DNA_ORIENTATION=-